MHASGNFHKMGTSSVVTNTNNHQKIHLASYLIALVLIPLLCPLVAHADGGAPNLAYVAGGGKGISVIDVAQQRIVRTLPFAATPAMLQLSADGSTLFLVQPSQNRALVIDSLSGKIRCQATVPGHPSLLVLSTQEDAFFVAGNGDNYVRAFAPTNCALLRSIPIHVPVYGLAIALDGGVFPTHTGLYQLCVASTNQVLVFDPDGQQLASYPIPAGPAFLTAPTLDFTIYVTTRQGSVVVIDLKTNQISPPLLSHGRFGPMDYDDTTKEVYVPDMQHQQVEVIAYKQGPHPELNAVLRVLPMNSVPLNVAVTNDGQLGFVALQNGNVLMLDLPGHQAMQTFQVGGQPHFIITGVYPSAPLPNQTPPSGPTSNTRSSLFLALLGTIFFLALAGLLVVLRLFWKQQHDH